MRIGGISFKGKNHDKNQDSYLFWKSKNKKLIVLSDGLGSRKYSEKSRIGKIYKRNG